MHISSLKRKFLAELINYKKEQWLKVLQQLFYSVYQLDLQYNKKEEKVWSVTTAADSMKKLASRTHHVTMDLYA